GLQQLVHGSYFDPAAANRRQTEQLEVNLIAGKVKRGGLASYYRLSGVKPLLAFIRDRSRQSDAVTAAVFRHLDRDGDGKLSREELLAAATSLRKLDLNDDEVIDREEVLPSRSPTIPTACACLRTKWRLSTRTLRSWRQPP